MLIAAAILAAGTSSRLGRAKQLLKIDDETLIRRTARTVLAALTRPSNRNCERYPDWKSTSVPPYQFSWPGKLLVVVNPSHAAAIEGELRDLAVEIVVNADWREGMASSVRLAVAAAGEAEALLITPCDLPRLSSEHLRALTAQFERDGARIVASRYNETLGAPLVIARELWPELLELRGDVGARRVITRHSASWVEWPDGALDVDTRADWEKLGYEF